MSEIKIVQEDRSREKHDRIYIKQVCGPAESFNDTEFEFLNVALT